MKLKPDTTVTGAYRPHGSEIKVVHDSSAGGTVYTYSYSHDVLHGQATLIVCAESFDDAYDAAIDALPCVPLGECHEAFGYRTAGQLDLFRVQNDGEHPELIEGYRFQDNAGNGTGIVHVGHFERLRPLTAKEIKRGNIDIYISHLDHI